MNILIDELPDYLTIKNKKYKINPDFITCILMEQLLGDNELSDKQKSLQLLNLFFIEEQPKLDEITAKEIEWFYRCGKPTDEKRKQEIEKRQGKKGKSLNSQIYDFEYDAPYIYAAFMQAYHIDLNDTYLHWWKFKALFDSLPDDCKIVKIMGYRATDIAKIKDKEEQKRIIMLKNIYAIPNKMTTEEKAAQIGAMF